MKRNWLFLRGLVREQRHWAFFPERFQKAFPEDTLHFLDLPGTGTESHRPSPLTIKGIRDDLRERWKKLPQDENPWSLFSISLGSMVGMSWAYDYPDDFKALVVVNASASNLSSPWKRLRYKSLLPILLAALKKNPVQRESEILRLTTELCVQRESLAELWATYLSDRHQLRKTALRQLAAALSFRAPRRIETPTLLLSSAADQFTHPDCSWALARHLGLSLKVHEKAGHDLPLDDPDWVLREVELFVQLLQ